MNRLYKRVFSYFIIAFCTYSTVYSQFSLPKVLADTIKYSKECRKIVASGMTQRKDICYILRDGKVTTDKYTDRIVKFNKNGSISECIYLDKDSRKKAIVVYEYYDNGMPKSEGEYHPTGEMLKRTIYKYDVEMQLREKSTVDQYGYVLTKTTYALNSEANRLTEKTYPFPSAVDVKHIWLYDNVTSGKLISHVKFHGETEMRFKRNFIYEKGLLVKEQYINPAGKNAFYLEYIYNHEGVLERIDKVLLDGSRLKNAVYDYQNGLLTGEIIYDRYGKMESYYKYIYE